MLDTVDRVGKSHIAKMQNKNQYKILNMKTQINWVEKN